MVPAALAGRIGLPRNASHGDAVDGTTPGPKLRPSTPIMGRAGRASMPSGVATGEGRLPLAGATGNSPVISLSSYYCSDGRHGRSWLIAIRVKVTRTDAYPRFWLPVLERAIRARSFRGRARKKAHSRKRKVGKARTRLPRNAGIPLLPKHVVPLCVGNLLGHGRN